jgi:hypothetical protein
MVAEAKRVTPPEIVKPAIAFIPGILSIVLLNKQFTGAIKLRSPVLVAELPESDCTAYTGLEVFIYIFPPAEVVE